MELRVLGPFEATDGAAPLPLGRPKTRALLARLALDANQAVAVERLVDDLWGDAAPDSAVKMVQISVSQLRKVLPEGVLRTRPPGYALELAPDALDATRFRALRAQGRAALTAGDPRTAAARFSEALAVWRGPALAEFGEPFAGVEAAHLEELRMLCLEERIEADLACGLHAEVIGELEALAARQPLRESIQLRWMLALYRAGRQADALAAYDRFRRRLDEELGIQPSAALRTLQQGILTQDPALDTGAPPSRVDASPGSAPDRFVGRAAELDRLGAALRAAAAGIGTTRLVAGRPGIGKTRLIEELAGRARERGTTVLVGRCIQLVGTGLPYLPLVDALRPLRGSPSLAGVSLRELPRLVPDLVEAPPVAAHAGSQLALFEEVLAVLARLASERTVLFVLEDLQWADESTLDLVAFLALAIRDHRILIVGTYRSDEVRAGDPLQRLAGPGADRLLALEPMPDADITALLGEPAELAARIAARSEGNPLFARELRAAAERGETTLPPALRDVLLAHVARVDDDTRALLRAAAAAGRDVSYGLLAAVMPHGDLHVAAALRQAVEHDLLAPDHAAGSFRFRHALLAEAVYDTLMPGEREVLHDRLARAVADEPRLAASGAAAAEVAQHWAAAGRPVEALAASLQAAKEAEAVSGLTEALGHVERVLELWDQVPAAEALLGVALPSVVAWAEQLADRSVDLAHEVDACRLVGVLGPGEDWEVGTVARRLGVSVEAASATLTALEAEGLVERITGTVFRAMPLAVTEARRLYPSVVVLESLALRQSPPFDRDALEALRAANDRLRDAVGDPAAAIAADDDFHRGLTAACGNAHLVEALNPVRRALLRYERVYMREPKRVERSIAQHEAIVAALERGDHAEAAQRLRENLVGGLPDLADALEH